jgi:hypothetical protein
MDVKAHAFNPDSRPVEKSVITINMMGREFRFEGCWIDRTRVYPPTLGGLILAFEYDSVTETWPDGRCERTVYTKPQPEPPRDAPQPKPRSNVGLWWSVILGAPTTLKDAEKAFKRACLLRHPDRGGTHEAMVELNNALDAARAWFR